MGDHGYHSPFEINTEDRHPLLKAEEQEFP